MVNLVVDIKTIKNTNPDDRKSLGLIGWKDNIHRTLSPCFTYWNTDQVNEVLAIKR